MWFAQVRTHAGFPGLLLLMAFASLALAAIPSFSVQDAAPLALLCLAGSVVTNVLERYLEWRVAQAKTALMHDYTKRRVAKYLESRDRFELQDSNTVIRDILRPLVGGPPDSKALSPARPAESTATAGPICAAPAAARCSCGCSRRQLAQGRPPPPSKRRLETQKKARVKHHARTQSVSRARGVASDRRRF
jgi:hypothetical protein